jgi:hypothetical protein
MTKAVARTPRQRVRGGPHRSCHAGAGREAAGRVLRLGPCRCSSWRASRCPRPAMLHDHPFDKGAMLGHRAAIQDSDLGLNPSNDGVVIRLAFPPLTEERRKEYVKLVKAKAEDGRTAVRGAPARRPQGPRGRSRRTATSPPTTSRAPRSRAGQDHQGTRGRDRRGARREDRRADGRLIEPESMEELND